jgi:hypothetical protein
MRLVRYSAEAAALLMVFMSLPAQAQPHRRHHPYVRVSGADSGGFGSGPFWLASRARRIVFQSGDTASTRVTLQIRSFAANHTRSKKRPCRPALIVCRGLPPIASDR